jgi:predicted metal-dependent hydrolase
VTILVEHPAPAPAALPARTPNVAYTGDTAAMWSGHVPEFACAANSVSLMMPYVEPYVARSVRAAVDLIDDPVLRAQAKGYVRQELAHHVEHRRFNEAVTAQVAGLRPIETLLRRTYARLARRPRLGTHLAFAAGSETVAYAAARWAAEHRRELFASADVEITRLFVWHLAEEVEHKTVAHDVFHAVDGSRRRFAWGMVLSFLLLALFTVAGTAVQLWHTRRLFHPLAVLRLVRWSVTFLFELLPVMVVATFRGHHPRDLTDPSFLVQWLRELDAEVPSGPQ